MPSAALRLRLRIAMARYRRVLVAALLAIAVAATLQAVRPPAPPSHPVPVATRDLPAGHRLTVADVVVRRWPAGAAPAGLLARPQGRILAAPVRQGEPVTDARVTPERGGGAAGRFASGHGPPGWTAVTVRLADPAGTALVAPGDHVQVVAGQPLDPLAAAVASGTGGAGGAGGAGSPASGSGSTAGPGTAAAEVVVPDAIVLATPDGTSAGIARGGAEGPGPGGGRNGDSGGLLGGLSAQPAPDGETLPAGLPAGVLALAVRGEVALDLVAVTGVRALTVTRQFPVSS